MTVIERSRAALATVWMVVGLVATGCQHWEGEYQGMTGSSEGTAYYTDLTFSGPDTALQLDFARIANSGLRPTAAFELYVVPPCEASLDQSGSTVSVQLCPVDPISFFLGSAVPAGATLNVTGTASAIAADSGQVTQITLGTAVLNMAGASPVAVPMGSTEMALARLVPEP